jgi:DNA repair protein RadD
VRLIGEGRRRALGWRLHSATPYRQRWAPPADDWSVLAPATWQDCGGAGSCRQYAPRLGHHLEERDWTLDGLRKRDREAAPSVKVCPTCFATSPSAAQVCRDCGHVFAPPERRELKQVEGELQEIAVTKKREQGKAQSLQDLIALGHSRGYKNAVAWAKHVMYARSSK